MNKKKQAPSGGKVAAHQKWADSVLMSDKPDKTGIELRFNAEPSPELQPKLRAMGFNLSRTQNKWYGTLTEANRQFVDELVEQISTTPEGPVLFFSPSAEAIRANVEKKEYSIVLITLKSGEGKHFLLFEPTKSKAEIIARQFAKSEFGEDFQTLMVTPRLNLKVARVLFEEGKIIAKATPVFTPHEQPVTTQTHSEEMKQAPESTGKIPVQDILLTTVNLHFDPQFDPGERFTSFRASDDFILPLLGNYSNVHYKVIWADGSSHSGMMDLEPAEFFKGRDNLLSTNVQNYFKFLASSSPNAVYSKADIEIANKRLRDYQLEDISDTVTSLPLHKSGEKQNEHQALAEVHKLLEEEGLVATLKKRNDQYLTEDSPADKMEELLREFHRWAPQQKGFVSFGDDSLKTLLDKWLMENRPDFTTQEKEKVWQAQTALYKRLSRLTSIRKRHSLLEPYAGNFKKLIKIIPNLIEHLNRGVRAGKSVVSPGGGLMDLHFDYLYKDNKGRFVIALAHYYQQEGDAMKDPDMQLRLDPELQTVEALTFEQSHPPTYQEVYAERDGRTLVNTKLKKGLNSFLRTWLSNLIHQGHLVDLTNAEVDTDGLEEAEAYTQVQQDAREGEEAGEDTNHLYNGKRAFELLTELSPELIPFLVQQKDTADTTKLGEVSKQNTQLFLHLIGKNAEKSMLSLDCYIVAQKMLSTDFTVDLNEKTAIVSFEWMDTAFAERYDRLKSESQLEEEGLEAGQDMNRAFADFLDDFLAFSPIPVKGFSDTKNVKAEAPLFDVTVMARCIAEDKFMSSRWRDTQKERLLPTKDFDAKEALDIEAFFSLFVLNDAAIEQKYRALCQEIKGTSSSINATSNPVSRPAKNLSYATNGKNHACFLPNILVPNGVVEPCISKHFEPFDMRALIHSDYKQFEKLRDTDIKTLRPTDLFVLLQLSASAEAGLKFNRHLLIKEFQERGGELFEQLGYPTDPAYPYVSLVMGYEMIEPLGEIIKVKAGEKQNYAFAAGSYRPIADLRKALDYIRVAIGNHERSLKKIQSSKVQSVKVQSSDSESSKIGHSIANLRSSSAVIESYLKTHSPELSAQSDGQPNLVNTPNSHASDITDGGEAVLINVLVPDQLHEPFLSMHLFEEDKAAEIDKAAPTLKNFTDTNLDKANALELLQLLKLTHPTEYGIKVSRGSVLKEWSKRGRQLFYELGYPTDPAYPYVNLYRGYLSIDPLEQILWDNNKQGDEWWSAAENYFPIANMQKALDLIAEMEGRFRSELEGLMNGKSQKPKSEFKEKAREIEFQIKDLDEARAVVLNYMEAVKEVNDAGKSAFHDPLANDSGVYTQQSAGNNLEVIIIPIPKSAQVRAVINVVKTSSGSYTFGIDVAKLFGDANGVGAWPSIHDALFLSREEALQQAFTEVESMLNTFLKNEDSILNNEDKKNRNIKSALQSFYQYAAQLGVDLSFAGATVPTTATTTSHEIIRGLESAYWTKADNQYPVDKVMIQGAAMHQARLRELIKAKIKKYPLASMSVLADELATRFKERRPLSSYQKGLVTLTKSGDRRESIILSAYVDDLIIDNDLGSTGAPVMNYLVETLFDLSEKLVDLPHSNPSAGKVSPKKMNQHELNKAIEAFVDDHDLKGLAYTAEDKNYIRQYSGSGGLLKQGASGRGVLYEYYTPDLVVQKMWGLVKKYGYDGGSVLEPSVGIGNFLRYAPKGATITGFETNSYSARIAQALYPHAKIITGAFETIFFARNVHLKNKFSFPLQSLVIGNPPYGEFTGKYAGMGEKAFTGALEYEQYFILRGLDLLKSGGLLCFIVPSSFLDNSHKSEKIKEKIAQQAELVDAYRLPIRTFETTDIGADIVLFKKK